MGLAASAQELHSFRPLRSVKFHMNVYKCAELRLEAGTLRQWLCIAGHSRAPRLASQHYMLRSLMNNPCALRVFFGLRV